MLGPIFVRELLTVPRRSRHYVLRTAYLGILWILGLTAWQALIGWSRTPTLGEVARFGPLLFQLVAFVLLALVLFFTALSAAAAVAQEKDRRTFVLLLVTDLRNHEIVLGKLASSLLQMVLFLLCATPVLFLIILLGGVAPQQAAKVMLVLAATALAAGSLGTLVAVWREKTFQTLALTVIFLVLYLGVVHALPSLAGWITGNCGFAGLRQVAAWQSWLEPFLALQSVIESPVEGLGIIEPVYGFAGVMVLLSCVLNAWGIYRLRAWNPSGEPIVQREQSAKEEGQDYDRTPAASRRIRHVWRNPILWREIATRAYGQRPVLVKSAYAVVLGLICYFALGSMWSLEHRPPFAAAWGLVPVGILSLLLLGAQAVTAITSERDLGALDLLLITDLTPREFIFGKLAGIGYNTLLYLLPPIVLTIVYACNGWLAAPPVGQPELLASRNAWAAVCVAGATLVVMVFAVVLGMHVALRTPNSRLAITNTLGTIFFLSVGTLVCIYLIAVNNRFEYQFTNFLFFIGAGIGGLWWILNDGRPSRALTLASWLCPLAVFYTITNILIAKPGSAQSTDPLLPFLVISSVFGYAIAAMLIPLISEFDIALGRTTGGE